MPSASSICQACGIDSSDWFGTKAAMQQAGIPVTWKKFKLVLGLDELGPDPDDPITCGPDEMRRWKAEFQGTAHQVYFDAVIGYHCHGCHDHVLGADVMLTLVDGLRQPKKGDWLPADEI
jgi:hypothetical protein